MSGGGEDARPDSMDAALAVLAAVLVAAVIALAYWARGGRRDTFVSQRARSLCQQSRDLFARAGPDVPYAVYSRAVPGADAVVYSDSRALWKTGALTPERLQATL